MARDSNNFFDIIISGRGFVGHAQTLALLQALGADTRIALLDRAPATADAAPTSKTAQIVSPNAHPEGGRAFAISAGTQRMLSVLGVWADVEEAAQPVHEIVLTDSSLEDGVRPQVMAYENALDQGEAASYIIQSDTLEAALRRRVEELAVNGDVVIVHDGEPVDLVRDEFAVLVVLANGTTVRAPLVVAAEGRASSLRKLAKIKLTSWSHDQTGIVTQVKHTRSHEGRAIQHFLPSGPFAILPLPGERSCITWSEANETAKRILGLDDEEFLAEVQKRFGSQLGELELIGPRQSWPLATHIARFFVSDRLALVGDAAHGVHPIAGQGLNLGLRDVAALTEVVADAARVGLDIGNGQTLAAYQQWRRFDSVVSTTAFDGLNRIFSNDAMLARAARDAGMSLLDRVPWAKKQLVKNAAGLAGNVPKLLRGEMV